MASNTTDMDIGSIVALNVNRYVITTRSFIILASNNSMTG